MIDINLAHCCVGRSMCFHPDGLCLYASCTDVLKVYGWEPSRSFESLTTGWGRIADLNIARNQLVGSACRVIQYKYVIFLLAMR